MKASSDSYLFGYVNFGLFPRMDCWLFLWQTLEATVVLGQVADLGAETQIQVVDLGLSSLIPDCDLRNKN